jgi:RimJ/RimL family protein N-acetyltransferase
METNRLIIRKFTAEDIDNFMIYRNNLDWMKFQGFKGLTKEEYEDILLKEPCMDTGCQMAIELKSEKKLIGDIYLKKQKNHIEIGFTLNPKYTKHGYTFEAVVYLKKAMFEKYHLPLYAYVDKNNIRSIRVLENAKIAYEFE